ncbi:peptidoglycan DD-metalloendopeptidase family protein [Streptomyces hypolithicus]
MDDQHAHAGYDGYSTGSFDADPLFGTLPTQGSNFEAGHSGQYETTWWDSTGAQHHVGYDAYGTQQFDGSGAWPQADHQAAADIPAQTTAQWDSNTWSRTGQFGTGAYETSQFAQAVDATGQWSTAPFQDTGAYDTTAWNTAHADGHTAMYDATGYGTGAYDSVASQQVTYGTVEFPSAADLHGTPVAYEPHQHAYSPDLEPEQHFEPESEPEQDLAPEPDLTPTPTAIATAAAATATSPVAVPVARRGAAGRGGRRRTPAKRSALLTVAVPSACVMGVAGIAAASVTGGGAPPEEKKDTTTTASAADTGSIKAVAVNNKLDTQLANLTEDADDFADRASRTQERIDLQARQAAEKKRKAEEAARKEAARPKFAVPVEQRGLSAYYGQAGVNWMSVHSGIDFPVSYGTPVMAATDGTVRTQYNSAYGNMAIVTAADGTETWYCHLSSIKIRSGPVQAGDVIAYAGNSGNSTGPHLHFEVRPGGGSAIDPLQWLRNQGLNPT